jgi:DNA-binding MarR family transcriptional regulator
MRERKSGGRGSGATTATDRHLKMLEVLMLFRVIFKSVRAHYSKVRKQTGVNGAELWALSHIGDAPGCTLGELASGLAVHQSTASNLVRRLVGFGLITRKRTQEDQRVISLQPTAKGKLALKRAPKPLIGVLQQALTQMPDAQLRDLHGLLLGLTRTMPGGEDARSIPLANI